MLAAVLSRSLSYSVQLLYESDNQPVRGAAIGPDGTLRLDRFVP